MKTAKHFLALTAICLLTVSSFAQTTPTGAKSYYRAFEMSVSEGLNLQAEAKVGIKSVYGMFGIGTQFLAEHYKWAFGVGVGAPLIRQEKHSLNLEYMIYHVNESEIWTDNFNNLQQIKLLYSKRIGEKLSFFGGPSLNLNIAENKVSYAHQFESTFPPYDQYSHVGDSHTAKGWIGLTLGLRFDKY